MFGTTGGVACSGFCKLEIECDSYYEVDHPTTGRLMVGESLKGGHHD